MKKITLILVFTLLFALFSNTANAQDGYTYTLQHNNGYSFTVQAVPNASANNFATSVQSYGFTIILPDGVTITTSSSLGGAASATFFDGNNVSMPTIDGYLITETLGSPATLTAPSAGTNTDLYTFVVNGNPVNGELKILENNSALANSVTPLKSFMQADMVDDGSAQYTNVVDPNALAVSGMSTFNFATLSINDVELLDTDVKIYPNPASNILNIQTNTMITKVEIFNLLGKKVVQANTTEINVSQLSEGMYVMKLTSVEGAQITKRFIKQ
ncbi:T9SS type A sorting domain-containing protein [Kordia jejudonensis]|uniref:T9SS type A sorting domain-containing protein n=1 Tax=Kordia jejudonensis TaxID=1348245 RepID=UPI00062939A2|nr:T9SS type A sorting domain-containing protein [Kordia jejudonensis]